VARIDEMDLPGEPRRAQIVHDGMAEAARPRTRADERDGLRPKQIFKAPRGHVEILGDILEYDAQTKLA
jgi:hypothetical protein